jgi:hypothetical protein
MLALELLGTGSQETLVVHQCEFEGYCHSEP